jgi:hypothetical protein
VSVDPGFAAVRQARVGAPALVTAPDGSPDHWLVPFELDGAVCGMARVDVEARRADVSTFGQGASDRAAWIDPSFFASPPERAVREIAARYPDLAWSAPRLSYDASPHKWGWRLDAVPASGPTLFITPGGWYSRRAPTDPGREG